MSIRSVSCALLVCAMAACGGSGNEQLAAVDSIEIVSVSPSSAPLDSTTYFTVAFRYTLVSSTEGVINIGFYVNDTELRLAPGEWVVSKGSSTGSLTVPVLPSWHQTTPNFAAGAILSAYPHPATWMPLARADKWIIPLVN